MIAILVPVLGRPKRARPLVESILENTETDCRIVFLTSPGDELERRAVRRLAADTAVNWHDVENPTGHGDYAKKINAGFRLAQAQWASPWVFQAADDLRFHAGWDTVALELAERREMGVIATNDLGNRNVMKGQFGTHCLIRSSYILECGGVLNAEPGLVMFEGYHHNYVDQELCGLARARDCFAFAEDSIVEHLHPNWKSDVPRDATYEKGESMFHKDQRLYQSRRRYWEGQRKVWNGPRR